MGVELLLLDVLALAAISVALAFSLPSLTARLLLKVMGAGREAKGTAAGVAVGATGTLCVLSAGLYGTPKKGQRRQSGVGRGRRMEEVSLAEPFGRSGQEPISGFCGVRQFDVQGRLNKMVPEAHTFKPILSYTQIAHQTDTYHTLKVDYQYRHLSSPKASFNGYFST